MSKEADHDGVFQALAHRVRRDIVRVLAEKGPRSFTELMRDVGVEDSSVMAFHMRKLGALIRKNEKGYYELTEVGWRAYRLLRDLEVESVSDRIGKVIESRARESKEEIESGKEITVSNAIEYRITRELVEKLSNEGKKLSLRNILLLKVDSDVDPEKLKAILGEVDNVLEVRAPKEIRDILRSTSSVPDIGSAIKTVLRGLIPAIVTPLVAVARYGGSGIEVRRSIVRSVRGSARKLSIDVVGSSIELRSGDSEVTFEGRGASTSRVDFARGVDKLKIHALEVDGVLRIPKPSATEILEVSAHGSDVKGEIELPRHSRFRIVGGDLELRARAHLFESLELAAGGGDVIVDIDIDDVGGEPRIDIEVTGGDLVLRIRVPQSISVDVGDVRAVGGDYVLNIPKAEGATKSIKLYLKIAGGDARVDVVPK